MKTSINQTLPFCKCCRRHLPIEAFYVNKETHVPDYYCKECRKESSRQHRLQEKSITIENAPVPYPVITEVKDSALRMALIRQALQVVAESVRRKQTKEKQRALWEE